MFATLKYKFLMQLGSTLLKWTVKLRLPFKFLIKKTIFSHFCGGETVKDSLETVKMLHKFGIYSTLDYSAEGQGAEKNFDKTEQEVLNTITEAENNEAIPFVVFKPTGVARFELLEKIAGKTELSKSEQTEWERVLARFDHIISTAVKKQVRVMIDAEETWIQDPIDDLVLKYMSKYNQTIALVFNTVQLYRTDRLDYLKKITQEAKNKNFKIGVKIVRGAYMEKERARAQKLNYPSPINTDKTATDKMYDDTLDFIGEELDTISVFAGTHNEESTQRLVRILSSKNIDPKDNRIWMAQLYGMSDHISFNLANAGYNVVKYLPFGPVREVVPYLLRMSQ